MTMRFAFVVLGLAFVGGCLLACQSAVGDDGGKRMLAHNVYFSLKDDSQPARQKLVAACKTYLAEHPGVVFFAAGTISDLDRPVNDRDFDVGLHVVFDSREAHDRYQKAPKHLQFIEENNDNWEKVRVFDTDLSVIKTD